VRGPKSEHAMRSWPFWRRKSLPKSSQDKVDARFRGGAATKVPRPCRRLIRPSSTRISMARVMVKRLTPKRRESWGSLSIRSPGALLAMSMRRLSMTCR